MSQTVFNLIDPQVTSGNALAQILNDFKDAVISGFIGPSRPSEIDPGGYWIDNSQELALNVWDYKVFTGTSDITVFRINLATGKPSIAGSDNTFEVTRISADSVGPLMKLIKKRIANNGQTLFGDVLGELQFLGAANDLTTIPTAKIKAIAVDNYTSLEQGSALIFETTAVDSNAIAEFMRIIDGKLGIGTTVPEEKVHVVGSVKLEDIGDSTGSSDLIFRKKRISGNGQVLSGDFLANQEFRSTDENGTEISTAKIEVTATETHTGLNQGTRISISTKNNGSDLFTEKIKIDSDGVQINGLTINSTNFQLKSEKGQPNGYAELDGAGKVPAAQLPSYVDDVLEYANLAAFPVTGETGKIYVALDSGKTYRWSGSIYVEISASEVNSVNGQTGVVVLDTDDVSEGTTNKYFTAQRAVDATSENALVTALIFG